MLVLCATISHAITSNPKGLFDVVDTGYIDEYPFLVSRESNGSPIMWVDYDASSITGLVGEDTDHLIGWALQHYQLGTTSGTTPGCRRNEAPYLREKLGKCVCSKDPVTPWAARKISFRKLILLTEHSNQQRLEGKPHAVCTMDRNQRACVSWAGNSSGILEDSQINKIVADCYGLCTSKYMACQHQVKQLHENESICFSDNPYGCGSWASC